MGIVEIKANIAGRYELYVDKKLIGNYSSLEKASYKAYKYLKGQGR